MNKLSISSFDISNILWGRMQDLYGHDLPIVKDLLIQELQKLEKDRPRMNYKTGSISLASSIVLFTLARHFRPTTIVEIGTFLGKSATSLALGSTWGEDLPTTLYTCDKDNDCFLREKIGGCTIKPHPRMTSTEMLQKIAADNVKADLFFIDGRLQADDLPLLLKMSHEQTLFLLDDFEGIEKGVANAITLQPHVNCLLLPPTNDGRIPESADRHVIGIMLPGSLIQITRQ